MTPEPKASRSFGEVLRSLRIKADKSMGQVARELGITTVYYSEVETGKKKPFPEGKVSYQKLASFLNTNRDELEQIAVAEPKASKAAMEAAGETFENSTIAYEVLVGEIDAAMKPEREAAEKMAEALRGLSKAGLLASQKATIAKLLAAYESAKGE